jgi:hypothetical protein
MPSAPTVHWTLVIDDNSAVPWIETPEGFAIVVKIKVLERRTNRFPPVPDKLAITTITYCVEGRNDLQKVYVHKPASQITLAEVKNRFPGVGGVFLFKTSGTSFLTFFLSLQILSVIIGL